MVRCILALPLTLALQGCFFFYIPGSTIDAMSDSLSGAEGQHCVNTATKVGDRLTINGTAWRVVSLSGTSSRCAQEIYPIRAKLEPATS